ncbi:organic solute transporter Ostalpha-domain-containing protein [Microdochium trichocladiopsis]|uniref:Organic solute transporter Ostalpha-domain-containing protein n=1 Tax=Microdochium trichocladiopsis TaxID=1682393 RepID=A0A9P8YB03_9PEZI|nr:organic solute transporter Ostalpha-domain-containing protein [Microdochium trichocladiopsis]KAH7032887.1 organic solute transporter Ostalpha-domain-containing protein [Microdochium trichocladiopsis]
MFGNNSGQKCNLTVRYVQTPTEPIIGDIQFHRLNLMVSGSCNVFAFLLVSGLMWCHATHMSNPKEQLDIMRIALLIPCYAILTLAAVYDANAWPFVKPWIEVCQGYALANFWILICRFTARLPCNSERHDHPQETRDLFFAPLVALSRKQRRRPLTLKRYRRHWVYIMQGPLVTLLVAVCTNIVEPLAYTCKLRHERALRMALSCTTIASMVMSMWTAIRHCGTLRSELWPHRAMFKMLSFKLILGLYIILEVIYMFLDAVRPSPLEPTALLSAADIEVGVPLMATSCELVLFAVFFCWAYSVTPYRIPSSPAPPTTTATTTASSSSPPPAEFGKIEATTYQGTNHHHHEQQQRRHYQGGPFGLKAWWMMLNHGDMLKGFLFPFVYMEEAASGGYTGQPPRAREDKWRYKWFWKLFCWGKRRENGKRPVTSSGSSESGTEVGHDISLGNMAK